MSRVAATVTLSPEQRRELGERWCVHQDGSDQIWDHHGGDVRHGTASENAETS